jgi:nucleoside phosphorylase
MSQDPVALVITALPVEYNAVRFHLSNVGEAPNARGIPFESGTFTSGERTWRVGIVQLIEAGNEEAAIAAFEAAQHFKPRVMMFVGVAGGIKDVALGDVVAATKVYAYGSGAAASEFLPRPDVGEPDEWLLQQAVFVARGDAWHARLEEQPGNLRPRAFTGAIAAGPAVLKSTQSIVFGFLRRQYSDALAVEMEGRGFLRAARKTDLVRAIVIRGISDLIDDKAVTDHAGWQVTAASHAAAFAFEVLSRGYKPSDADPSVSSEATQGKSDPWDDWYESILSEGGVIYDDPWKRWTCDAERNFKKLLKGRWNTQLDYWNRHEWLKIVELWEPLRSNEFFDVEHPHWQDKPYFRCQIHAANSGLFVAHAQLAAKDDEDFGHYRQAAHYLREVLKEHPYAMLGSSSERLSIEHARAQNDNFVTTLEFAHGFLAAWGGRLFRIIDLTEEDGEELKEKVEIRMNELHWVLSRHPER